MQRSPLLFSCFLGCRGEVSPLWTEYAPHVLKFLLKYVSFKVLLTVRKKVLNQHMQTNRLFFMTISHFAVTHTHTQAFFIQVHAICALTYADFLHARMHLFLLVSHPHTHTLVHTLELLRSNSWCQCAPWGLWALKSVRFNSPTGSSVWVKISSHSQRIFIQTQAHILGIWFHSYRSPTASLEFMQSVLWCSLRKRLCFFVSAQLKVAAYCSLITASFSLLICAHLITFMSPLEFCIIHLLLRCFLSVHFLSVFAFCYFCCNYSFFQSGFYSPLL